MLQNATTSTVKFSVPDLSCAHCERTVKAALEPLVGAGQVTVDLADKTVQVSYDANQVAVERLAEALASEGYPAEPIGNSRDSRSE